MKAKYFVMKYDRHVAISLQDVESLMGLPSQGHDIQPIASQRTSNLHADLTDKRNLKENKETGITYSSLLEKMQNKELPLEEFLQCFVLYTIGKILCPTTGLAVNSKYLSLVDSVQKVRSINWAKLTVDHFCFTLGDDESGHCPKYVTCAAILRVFALFSMHSGHGWCSALLIWLWDLSMHLFHYRCGHVMATHHL
jgi:hypothetical protein